MPRIDFIRTHSGSWVRALVFACKLLFSHSRRKAGSRRRPRTLCQDWLMSASPRRRTFSSSSPALSLTTATCNEARGKPHSDPVANLVVPLMHFQCAAVVCCLVRCEGRRCHHLKSDLNIVGTRVACYIPPCHTCRLVIEKQIVLRLCVLTAFVRHALASKLGLQSLILSLSLLSNIRSYHRCGHLKLQIIVLGTVVQVFSSSRDF